MSQASRKPDQEESSLTRSGLSDQEREAAKQRAQRALQARSKHEQLSAPADAFLRPANEDDDGYDPYSDRPAKTAQHEEDPWR